MNEGPNDHESFHCMPWATMHVHLYYHMFRHIALVLLMMYENCGVWTLIMLFNNELT